MLLLDFTGLAGTPTQLSGRSVMTGNKCGTDLELSFIRFHVHDASDALLFLQVASFKQLTTWLVLRAVHRVPLELTCQEKKSYPCMSNNPLNFLNDA